MNARKYSVSNAADCLAGYKSLKTFFPNRVNQFNEVSLFIPFEHIPCRGSQLRGRDGT